MGWEIVRGACFFVLPSRRETQTWDSGEEVNFAGRDADAELGAFGAEIFLSDSDERYAEICKRMHQLFGILSCGFEPNINVLRVARLRIVNHRVATYNEVTDIKFV